MVWVLIIVGVIILGTLLYWAFVSTEGVFLGRRMVIWLYDLTANKYDSIKEFSASDDSYFIARPLIRAVRHEYSPLILDVATGTGRVPVALLREPDFDGFVVGLDASKRMLAHASVKLGDSGEYAGVKHSLVQQLAAPLPFPDNTFDLLCCLQALEFFPSGTEALAEMVRVLKPGCTLFTSRRRGRQAKLFLGRYRSRNDFEAFLLESGLVDVQISLWELDYDIVTARKALAVVENAPGGLH